MRVPLATFLRSSLTFHDPSIRRKPHRASGAVDVAVTAGLTDIEADAPETQVKVGNLSELRVLDPAVSKPHRPWSITAARPSENARASSS